MILSARAAARIDVPPPETLLGRLAEQLREADLAVEQSAGRLSLRLPHVEVELARDARGLDLSLAADSPATLHQFRDYLLFLLDHAAPESAAAVTWAEPVAHDAPPPTFDAAVLREVRRIAPRFLRVELDCAGAARLAAGRGLHFTLLLPPAGRTPVWPRLDASGRTVWPAGEDALHRAAYTFVSLDPGAGRLVFDVFEHDGGRTTEWARAARPGAAVGVMGPGGGVLPAGDELLVAGDETALPAIRRILEASAPDRRGEILVEVASRADVLDLPHPAGMRLEWLPRDEGGSLWDRLRDAPAPEGPSRHVWVAAEQALVRKARARFRGELGLRADETYLAAYWTA